MQASQDQYIEDHVIRVMGERKPYSPKSYFAAAGQEEIYDLIRRRVEMDIRCLASGEHPMGAKGYETWTEMGNYGKPGIVNVGITRIHHIDHNNEYGEPISLRDYAFHLPDKANVALERVCKRHGIGFDNNGHYIAASPVSAIIENCLQYDEKLRKAAKPPTLEAACEPYISPEVLESIMTKLNQAGFNDAITNVPHKCNLRHLFNDQELEWFSTALVNWRAERLEPNECPVDAFRRVFLSMSTGHREYKHERENTVTEALGQEGSRIGTAHPRGRFGREIEPGYFGMSYFGHSR